MLLLLRSILQTLTRCLQWPLTRHGAVARKDSLELTPALNSTPACLLPLQPALEAALERLAKTASQGRAPWGTSLSRTHSLSALGHVGASAKKVLS